MGIWQISYRKRRKHGVIEKEEYSKSNGGNDIDLNYATV